MSVEIFNVIGNALLLICSVPQALKSIVSGNSDGISKLMLWMWFAGMLLCLVFFTHAQMWPNVINYGFNLGVCSVIIRYAYFPRKS